jgi:hypothetical protein
MEISYSGGLASHTGPESCVGVRKGDGEALTAIELLHTPAIASANTACEMGLLRVEDGLKRIHRTLTQRVGLPSN